MNQTIGYVIVVFGPMWMSAGCQLPRPFCESNSDCVTCGVCVDGSCDEGCLKSCSLDSECGPDEYCREGLCGKQVCGNGAVEPGEQCDNGAQNGDHGYCTSSCREAHCGDGLVYIGHEVCDDGNTTDDGNGCDAFCQRNDRCGNDAVEKLFEACDDGNTTDDENGCDTACQRNDRCGNDIVEDLFEICDDGNTLTETECPYGEVNCTRCDPLCDTELDLFGAFCGDGQVDMGNNEECDTEGDCPTCNTDCTRKPTAVIAGTNSTCALLHTGAVKCWGGDEFCQLGSGSPTEDVSTPVDVDGIDGTATSAVAVAAGSAHSCALLNTGAVKCWGNDAAGQLGDGGPVPGGNHCSPVDVDGIDSTTASAIAVAAGAYHTCVVFESGAAKCWGAGTRGQVGDGGSGFHYQPRPVDVEGIDGTTASAVAIAAGNLHTCALLDTGAVKCWGQDDYNQLGNGGVNASQSTPVNVVGIDGKVASAVAVAAGERHTCALLDTGAAKCWGDDTYGQLGNGAPNVEVSTPVDVDGIDGAAASAIALSAGRRHTCALLKTGAVKCWGYDSNGQLGDGGANASQRTPVDVDGIDGTAATAVEVTAGYRHTCALLVTGAVKCWGWNDQGQLGNGGTGTDQSTPVDVVGIP